MTQEEKEQWNKGFDDGYKMASTLGRPVRTEDFPNFFVHRGNAYSKGYAEGVISGGIYLKR